MRNRVLCAVVAAALLAPVVASAAPAGGELLVVQANLQDALRPADAADTRDLDTFVRRVLDTAPRPPDALLLTEVLGPGAERVADRLSRATRERYTALVKPGRSPFLADGAVRESAILVNRDRVKVLDRGGFTRVQSEDQAHAVVERGGLTVPLVSGHVAGDPLPAATALADLQAGDLPVIGADLRHGRCAVRTDDQPIDCAPAPHWAELTLTRGYSDALFEAATAQERPLVGFVLARGAVERAFVDAAYDPGACKAAFDAGRSWSAPAGCRWTYYADAPLGWAIVRPGEPVQRTVVPDAAALDHCELATRNAAVIARVVNNSGEPVADPVAAAAPAPLTATPEQDAVEVPPGEARNVAVRIQAPRGSTPTGTYEVTISVGPLTRTVAVRVPETCDEPAVYTTSFHPGFEPEKAIDGDIATFWHSEYSPPTPLPQSLTLNLGEQRQVSELTYQPRFDGNLNGTITAYNVSVSADGESFTQVASGTWAPDARLKTAAFAPVAARYVRLEATAGHNGDYASAAEVAVR
jgi:F5/8 type C domain-containing protein